jgi:hypothetical protein
MDEASTNTKVHQLTATLTRWNVGLLGKRIAPEIHIRPEVNLADLTQEFPQSEFWFVNYFSNSVFRLGYGGKFRLHADASIARIQFVFRRYHEARFKTLDYARKWQDGTPNIDRYLVAIDAWEKVFLDLQIIFQLLPKIPDLKFPKPENDKKEYRIRRIGNRIKHHDEDVHDSKLKTHGVPM